MISAPRRVIAIEYGNLDFNLMTVIVTGAAGFVGSAVALALLARGEKVVGIDNINDYYDQNLKKARLERLLQYKTFEFHKVDIAEPTPVKTVFTKYPNITKNFFSTKGIQVETIKLNGSIELAPTLLMCRRVVDLVSTGRTLKENGLREIEKIMEVQSKLIINRSAYKTKTNEIESIISIFKNCVQ